MEKAMNFGTNNRKTASTKMNDTSSRSHSIFTIYIETATNVEGKDKARIKAGKLNLVDLAVSFFSSIIFLFTLFFFRVLKDRRKPAQQAQP